MSTHYSPHPTIIDFSNPNVQDQINSTYAMFIERPHYAFDEPTGGVSTDIVDIVSKIVVSRQNITCGLNAVQNNPAYSILMSSVESLKRLDKACSDYLENVKHNSTFEARYMTQIALCYAYGWFGNIDGLRKADDILNRLWSKNQFPNKTEKE
jgi:hypothetical protein